MALRQRGGLGRGLEALIGGETNIPDKAGVMEVNINDVEPGPHQPRKRFDEEKMEQLTNSIKQYGIIDPLIVKKDGDKYFIIAGERRWRAARKAGLKTVPIVERDGTDRETMEIALIENIQRADLNPIEEAEAYKRLISEYNLTQEQLSEKVGKNRTTITNSLRLLNFDKEIREMLADGRLTAGQARPLLSLENKEDRIDLANRIISADLSTRQAEMMAKRISDIRSAEKGNGAVSRWIWK